MPTGGKPRSMTFTGCWTCKRRKVKCDERPSGCQNCARLGVQCEGYKVKLQWVADPFIEPDHNSSFPSRGRIRIGGQELMPSYRMEEINDFLASIEEQAQSTDSSQQGPFTFFLASSGGREWTVSRRYSPSGEESPRAECIFPDSASHNRLTPPDALQQSVLSSLDSTFDASDLLLESNESRLHGTTSSLIEEEVDLEPVTLDGHTGGHLTVAETESLSPAQYQAAPLSLPLTRAVSNRISGDSAVDKLMHHYLVHVADLLQPVQHPLNPYRNLYFPAALEAASGLMPHEQASRATLQSVLLHSLLSSSAFHLWNCDPSNTKYHRIGVQHRHKALRLLQTAISPSTPVPEYRTLMMAILSLVTIDVLSGCEADFAIHLHATQQLRQSRRNWKLISSATQQLNEIGQFLCLLLRTVSFTSPPPSLSPPLDTSDSLTPKPDRCCYTYMYGITPAITTAIQETCRLADLLALPSNQPPPEPLLSACEFLGDRLLSWSLDVEPITSIAPTDQHSLAILTHHANAWHLAALVYYYRRIQGRQCAEYAGQIDQIAEHMHAVEDIKADERGVVAGVMAPIAWPAFVASCDATDREPWVRWWGRVRSYRIANMQRLWEIVGYVWMKRDEMVMEGLEGGDWVGILADSGLAVMPV